MKTIINKAIHNINKKLEQLDERCKCLVCFKGDGNKKV